MAITETTLLAERVSLLNSEDRADVLAWLTSPRTGVIEKEWDE